MVKAEKKLATLAAALIFALSMPVAISAAPAAANGKTFTLQELAKFDGKNGNPAYIAVNGVVYDVTSQFRGGSHNGFPAGKDYSKEFFRQHEQSRLGTVPTVGKLVPAK